MSHAESQSHRPSTTELRVPVAPDVALHVERYDGDPAAHALRARPRARLESPAVGRRRRGAPRQRSHRGRAGPARPRPVRRARVELRHGHRRGGSSDGDRDGRALAARAGRPVVGRQRRARIRLAPSRRRSRHRLRRRRHHRARRVVPRRGRRAWPRSRRRASTTSRSTRSRRACARAVPTCPIAPSPPPCTASASARTVGSSRAWPGTVTCRSSARSGSTGRPRAIPTLEAPTLLVLADTGDEARTTAKRRAESQALAVSAAPALALVLARAPRRALAVPRSRGGRADHGRPRTASSDDRAARAGDHGLGRDRAHHGDPPSRHRRPLRRRGAARRAPRHALRLPGKRGGDLAAHGGLLRAARAARDRHRRLPWPARRQSPPIARRSPPPPPSRACARPTSCSPDRAARRTRCRRGAARRCRRRSPTSWPTAASPSSRARPRSPSAASACPSTRSTRSVSRSTGSTGLDLLSPLGFGPHCVVVPHWDNAEGGTHDTRFCYMGERRLAALEEMLPDDAWVLGIDEHTALVVDLDAGEAAVSGRGGVTVRRRGVLERFRPGRVSPWPTLVASARGDAGSALRRRRRRESRRLGSAGAEPSAPAAIAAPRRGGPPRASVCRGLAARRANEAAEAILALDRTILEWSADTLQTDDPDRARAVLHSLVHRLGESASAGLRDPKEPLASARGAPDRAARRAPHREGLAARGSPARPPGRGRHRAPRHAPRHDLDSS